MNSTSRSSPDDGADPTIGWDLRQVTAAAARSGPTAGTVIPMARPMLRLLLVLLAAALYGTTGCSATPSSTIGRDRTSEPIRVATWNIKHGRGLDGRVDLERTATVIEALDAHIVALQEVDEEVDRSGRVDQGTWLAERLGMHVAFGSFMDFQGGRYGMAILSEFPIEHSEAWRLADGHEPRVALAVRVRPPTGPDLTIVGVHFDWVEDDAFRYAQARETMGYLSDLETPWIVLGDFNDTPDSRTIREFRRLGREAVKPKDACRTFPADDPLIEIDFIVTGPADCWSIDRTEVIDESIASDHRPVVATLRRRAHRPTLNPDR